MFHLKDFRIASPLEMCVNKGANGTLGMSIVGHMNSLAPAKQHMQFDSIYCLTEINKPVKAP